LGVRSRTARATHISSPRGRVGVAIDFSSQIYGFLGHKTNEPAIYDCEKYSIWSDLSSVPTDINKLHEKTDFYNTKHVYVSYCNDPRTLLLEDEAYKWFMYPERTWHDFNSKDFLEQTFITHTVRRLQQHVIKFEPWKDLLKKYHSEDEQLLNRVLQILEPKISEVAKYIYNNWHQLIDYDDIYSRAYSLVESMVCGDKKSVVGGVVDKYKHRTGSKSSLKSLNRDIRIHPFSTHSKSSKSDIKKTFHENTEYLSGLIKERISANSPIVETLMLLSLIPDARSSWLTASLNRSSERIYTPSSNVSVVEFIFGKKGCSRSNIVRYLKDSFHTEKNRARKFSRFNEEVQYEPPVAMARRWKKNDISKYTAEDLASLNTMAEKVLKGKLLMAYRAYLNRSLNFSDVNERQRLSRARKILREKSPNSPH